jgi:hypothetical protein
MKDHNYCSPLPLLAQHIMERMIVMTKASNNSTAPDSNRAWLVEVSRRETALNK